MGLLTYYPNNGGGYTFKRDGHIEFYALPCSPTTYQVSRNITERVVEKLDVLTISKSKMPFGGQTVYCSEIKKPYGVGVWLREDTPLATWSRDSLNGQFRLSIVADDPETRLKLKSVVPVLEHAPNPRLSKP